MDNIPGETTSVLPSTDFGGFEGPEKLLEIWFASSPDTITASEGIASSKLGLRAITRADWVDILKLVHCEILSVISNCHVDAYLLSESSLFVYPHKLVLKTCGTTTLLVALPKLLEKAKEFLLVECPYRVFYSRKAFMFPEKQLYPHSDWKQEVEFLDKHFENGAPYIIGRTNGDHWYLYSTPSSPDAKEETISNVDDFTIEILMTGLNEKASKVFYLRPDQEAGHVGGAEVARTIGLNDLYPGIQGDAFLFSPCGFSMNALHQDQYFNIHVTPEQHCSYASFEANIPLSGTSSQEALENLVSKVIEAFGATQFTVTLFKSHNPLVNCEAPTLPMIPGFSKSDNILYDFDGYYLRYCHFKTAP
ncbi:spermidine resistance protein [Entomophthora muscae]|uniref:Spermidine resistance protein n=1 Tax=Entomophthora muscae TaxID=34485 RepID=A0ACC2SZU1_9FUNG|nr:spermidine resistance protein [Entomophthora muscae]